MATCGQCSLWIAPLPCYEKNSMGACSRMDGWIAKHKAEGRRVDSERYNEMWRRCGSAVPMPDIPRNCEFFEGKE